MIHIDTFIQGSEGWLTARLGKITASNLSKVLAKGEGLTRKRYMRELAAELITGVATETYNSSYMQRGTELEPEARAILSLEIGDIQQTGFIWNPEKRAGCSPDGLIGEDGLAEFKCVLPVTQIERLDKGSLPSENMAQCLGALWITGRKYLKFQSYCPGLPRLVIHVEPNPTYFQMLEEDCGKFNKELDELVIKIKNLY